MSSINSLFDDAQDEGMLSPAAAGILVNNLSTTTNAAAQGVAVDDLAGDEVTLFLEILDMTGSMSPHQDAVIRAYNDQLKALGDSKAADSIIMSTLVFNTRSTVLHGYQLLPTVPNLDRRTYNPDNLTALYDAVIDGLTGVVAYNQSLRNSGIRTKVVIVVISDGEDNQSRTTAAHVKTVVEDMLQKEIYTFAFVAFGTDGKRIAGELGFPPQNVMDESTDASSIRRALGTISKSVIRASQTTIGAKGSQNFFA